MLRKKLRAAFSFPVMLGSVLVGWVYFKASGGIGDPDLWWHLRNADYLWTHGKLPAFDTFSYTTLGHPWMNHEWLAEVPYYLGWRVAGLVGIYVVFSLLLEAILLGLFYLSYKSCGNVKGAFLASGFTVLLAAVGFGPRVILFGYLYLLILLSLLWRFRTRQPTGRGPLWLIPPLFCLWINTHGSWLLGMIVFGIVVGAGLWEGRLGRVEVERWSPEQLKRLLWTGVASIAALFVNPFGYRLVIYPFDLAFRQKLNIGNVVEWASVNFHEDAGKVAFVLIVALLLGGLLSNRPWKLSELALALFGLYCGLTYIRFLFLTAILITPLLAKMLDVLPPYRPEIDKRALNAAIIVGIVVFMAVKFPSEKQLEENVAKNFPVAALAHVGTEEDPGPIFNLYEWGGYIAWKAPSIKTFIDGRADIYEYAGAMKDYLDAAALKNTRGIFEKYGVRCVIFPPENPLSYFLRQDPEWQVTYSDKVCQILVKTPPDRAAPVR
ncbi:MAG: hypothetical protein HYS61_01735 [Acidobacteria bacterium]|nr:hypothetical protein [Acidobacteriota bacterium]